MPKIAVTTFYSPNYEPLAAITIPVLRKWTDKHGYFLNINKIEDGNKHHFIKTKDARKLLDEYEIVMMIENDVLLTNLSYEIWDFVTDKHVFFICKDINNYNGGVCVVKNSLLGKQFMDFINCHEGVDYIGDEQNVMEICCGALKEVRTMQHPSFNSIPYDYYAPSYGYINWEQYNPRKEKPTHEMGCWEKGDFCAHLPGKTLEERISIFNELKQHIIYE